VINERRDRLRYTQVNETGLEVCKGGGFEERCDVEGREVPIADLREDVVSAATAQEGVVEFLCAGWCAGAGDAYWSGVGSSCHIDDIVVDIFVKLGLCLWFILFRRISKNLKEEKESWRRGEVNICTIEESK